jgi:putative MATE family efflux protein
METKVDLLNGDIKKSLIKLSIPLTLTAFVQMAYHFVDMIWIGRIGTKAVAAVGVASFLIWLANSLSFIPKIGMGVLSSQAFGRGNKDQTAEILNNGYLQATLISIFYTFLVLAFKGNFIGFYKLGTDVEIMANDYLFIVGIGMIFVFLNPVFSQSFHSMGDSSTPFRINSLGLVFNIIMDPILIFGRGIFPKMGIKGAALATASAQGLVSLIFILKMRKEKNVIGKSLEKFEFSGKWQKRIFKLGLPASILNAFHAVITIILNKFMADFGPRPVAVYSIGSQLESISWMTTEGCQVAISSLVAQNYGAEKIDRVLESTKAGLKLVASIGLVAGLILFVFRNNLFKIFVPDDPETIALGAKYLAILSLSQFFMSLEIGATGVFNGLSDTRTPALVSMILNFARIPISMLLMKNFLVLGVWMSMTISSILKGIIDYYLLKKKLKKEIYPRI